MNFKIVDLLDDFKLLLDRRLDISKISDGIPLGCLLSTTVLAETVDKLTDNRDTDNLLMISKLAGLAGIHNDLIELESDIIHMPDGQIIVKELPVYKELDRLSGAVYILALMKVIVKLPGTRLDKI